LRSNGATRHSPSAPGARGLDRTDRRGRPTRQRGCGICDRRRRRSLCADESAAGGGGEVVQLLLLLAGILGALCRVLLLHRHAPTRASQQGPHLASRRGVSARDGAPFGELVPRGAGARGWRAVWLALHEDRRAAIGVLGTVPSLLDLFAGSSPALVLHRVVRPNRNKSFFYRNFMTKLKISLCEVAILLLHKNNEVEINFTFFKFELVKSRLFDSLFLKMN
jgi:hypothetical protein